MKHIYLIILLIISITTSYGQLGGKGINSFINLPSSARETALGGTIIGVVDDDVSLAMSNPAVLNEQMMGGLSFSHQFHFADIASSHANYGFKLPWYGLKSHVGLQYLSYGDFVLADIYGTNQGGFTAKDVAIVAGVSKTFDDKLSIGINAHFFNSAYDSYTSSGIGMDIGAVYKLEDKKIVLSAVIRNLDIQLIRFNQQEYAKPDLQLGITKRLKHLPLRVGIVAHNLQRWSIRYDDPNKVADNVFLDETTEKSRFNKGVDNLFRHLLFSGEFLFGKKENFKIRFAYNHIKRQELSIENYRSLAGFSGGLGIKIKGIRIDYGFAYYHLVGSSKHITISTNLNRILRKF